MGGVKNDYLPKAFKGGKKGRDKGSKNKEQ